MIHCKIPSEVKQMIEVIHCWILEVPRHFCWIFVSKFVEMSGRALQKWLQLVFTFKASRLRLGILGESLSKSVKDDLKVNKSKDVRIRYQDSRPNLFCKLRQMFLLSVKFVKLFCSLAKRGTSLKQGRCVKGKNCFLDRFLALLLGA